MPIHSDIHSLTAVINSPCPTSQLRAPPQLRTHRILVLPTGRPWHNRHAAVERAHRPCAPTPAVMLLHLQDEDEDGDCSEGEPEEDEVVVVVGGTGGGICNRTRHHRDASALVGRATRAGRSRAGWPGRMSAAGATRVTCSKVRPQRTSGTETSECGLPQARTWKDVMH